MLRSCSTPLDFIVLKEYKCVYVIVSFYVDNLLNALYSKCFLFKDPQKFSLIISLPLSFFLLLPFHWTFHHWYVQVMFCLLSLGFKHLLECRDSIRSGGLVEAPHVLVHLREALFHIVLSTAFSNCAKAKPQRRVMELEKSNEKWTYVWKRFENIIPSFTKKGLKYTMVL